MVNNLLTDNALTKQAMLKEEHEQIQAMFHELVVSIRIDQWESPTVNPAWNVRQLIWHMIFALKMMPSDIVVLRKVRKQFSLPFGKIFHPLNRIITRVGAWRLTSSKALQQYDAAHDKLMKILETISESEFDLKLEYPDWDPRLSGEVSLERLFHYPKVHFFEHVQQIQQSIDLPSNFEPPDVEDA